MFAHTATLALLASSVAASSVGSAVIVNKCSYDAYLSAVPAGDGGYSNIDKTLKPGDQFSQQWTQLTNNCGWSLKLTPDESKQPMQFEYTWLGSGRIWFDMSYVNGDPFNGDWVIDSEGDDTCHPLHKSYLYPTDDKHAMQDCDGSASITVVLCGDDSSSPSTYSSTTSVEATSVPAYTPPAYSAPASTSEQTTTEAPAPTSTQAPSTSEAPSSTTVESPPAYTHHHWTGYHNLAQSSSAPAPTTFATQVTEADGEVVTVIDTAYVTDYVTQTLWVRDAAPTATPAKKRHQHHPHSHHA